MARLKYLASIAVLAGCAVHDRFTFTLSDGTVATSGQDATGAIDNAGFVTLSDSQWSFTMNLLGIAPGNHAITAGAGDFQLAHAATGTTFMVSLGGTCNIWLDAHGATNGSPVTGHLTCTGLTSTTGTIVDITNATFEVPLDDPANNPGKK